MASPYERPELASAANLETGMPADKSYLDRFQFVLVEKARCLIPNNTVAASKVEDAGGPIKDDDAGAVNCIEVASMQEESPDDSYNTAAWCQKGKRGSLKPDCIRSKRV